MTPSLSGLLIGALAFAIAFGIAKFISRKRRRHNLERDQQVERSGQSRQVRRAHQRKKR